jgi:signal transduction histidine kinase
MTLRPVAAMTRKAADINVQNLEERIPVQGRAAELDELATVLNQMLDGLSESLRRTAAISVDAAHQLRTPLTRIRAQLELMLREDVCPTSRENLESLQREALRLSQLCTRLLLLGRLELHAGEAGSLNERIDLSEVVEEITEQCRPAAQDRGIALESDSAGAVAVRGNRVLLVEACLNLLDNAIRWTPCGGCVRVSTTSRGGEAVLWVTDSGPGIPDHERSNIFRPFYRGKRTSASPGDDGFGLGLSIVRAIAELHSGHVELLQSSAAHGCTFSVTLPTDFG